MSDNTEYAAWIKNLREEYGMTQQEMADDLGVTRSTLSYVERGIRQPSEVFKKRVDSFKELMSFRNCTGDELIDSVHNRLEQYSDDEEIPWSIAFQCAGILNIERLGTPFFRKRYIRLLYLVLAEFEELMDYEKKCIMLRKDPDAKIILGRCNAIAKFCQDVRTL